MYDEARKFNNGLPWRVTENCPPINRFQIQNDDLRATLLPLDFQWLPEF